MLVCRGWRHPERGLWPRDSILLTPFLQQKEQEASKLKQEVEKLQGQKQELLGCASVGKQGVASLKEKVWELESSALEQQKVHSQQENTIKQLEQVKRSSLSRGCSALGWVLPQCDGVKY